MFNPRMKSVTASTANIQRKYQKVTDCKQMDVFTIDYLTGVYPMIGVPFTPDNWAHWPFRGLQAGFTDGSARFCTLTDSVFNGIVNHFQSDESQMTYFMYNTLFNALQNAP